MFNIHLDITTIYTKRYNYFVTTTTKKFYNKKIGYKSLCLIYDNQASIYCFQFGYFIGS